MVKTNTHTVGSLFAGVGGICQGFADAGFNVIWANDNDKFATLTYEANFAHNFDNTDIHTLNPSDFKKVDVITSGFPCQAFSIAGYQKGFKDCRGNLFFETMRFVKDLKPKAILLENVKNLKSHDKGKTFRIIEDCVRDYGYSFIPKVLNTMEYGNIPQTRERIFIVGFRDEADFDKAGSKALCSRYFSYPSKIRLKKTVHNNILQKRKAEDRYYYTEKSKYYKILKKQMKSKDTVYQWRRVYLRENKSGVCPTLTANMGTGGHNVPLVLDGYGIRKLTPRECARLQGFKDSFKLPEEVANTQLYKQMGNCVTVSVIKRIAQQIKKALDAKNNTAQKDIAIRRSQQMVFAKYEKDIIRNLQ